MVGIKEKAGLLIKLLQAEIQSWVHYKHLNSTGSNLLNDLRQNGYAVIDNFYSPEKCNEIKSSIDQIIEKYPEVLWIDDAKSDYRVFGAERASPSIQAYFNDENLHSLGEQLLRVDLINHMTLAARLEYKKNNPGSGGGWHRDSPFENQFKSIIYLNDVDSSNGPYQFVKGSHKLSNQFKTLGYGEKLMRFSNDEIQEITRSERLEIKTFVGKKGTCILTNTRGLHRGKPIEKGIRYALTNYYSPKHQASTFASYFTDVIKEPLKPFRVE